MQPPGELPSSLSYYKIDIFTNAHQSHLFQEKRLVLNKTQTSCFLLQKDQFKRRNFSCAEPIMLVLLSLICTQFDSQESRRLNPTFEDAIVYSYKIVMYACTE